jgi:glycosyltransferase involved in cell wall biosynthesis
MVKKNSKKCVLSVCDIAPVRFGSFEEFMVGLTKRLKAQGYEHVIIFREWPIESVECALFEAGAYIEKMVPHKSSIINFIKMNSMIRTFRPDVIHFHFYPIHTALNCLKLLHKVQLIYTGHMGGKRAKTQLRNVLRKVYYSSNSFLFDGGIDKIICVSKYVKEDYFREYGIKTNKACVIYNGINVERYSKKEDIGELKQRYGITDEFVITCVSLRKDKGAHCLVKAAPKIIDNIKNVKFMLVGSGECKDYLMEKIKNENLADYFIFTGIVPDIADIYSISSCVVMPSIFEEACPFTAIEAMACGSPVISFDSGGAKEVVTTEVGYIIEKKVELLSDTIINYYKNNEYISMSQKGVTLMRDNFSIELCIDEYINVYVSLTATN